MAEIYANVEYDKPFDSRGPFGNETGPRSSERRFHGAVVLCLGLLCVLLLAGLIGLSVHYHVSACGSAADVSAIKTNLTERLQASENKISSLTEDRDRLKARIAELTAEKTCPAGWMMFSSACYLLSAASGSWDEGRKDCRDRGADLVVIDSPAEQTFVVGLTRTNAWIGLSDRDVEGTWKWIDGTPLTFTRWGETQPDNGGGDPQYGEEDCAHIRPDTYWNDLSCETSMQWICEKTA
ncbi:CD209 antigen-like protein E [Plectropomus leopardus]|uniref:CD209 antigen-like protein E n=1 Tax=Plectropomus leopardus TaxID=160734 RepID=UPI001C4B1263|nr:CD209 antigen-like protein E [Plectropomus leopardus]